MRKAGIQLLIIAVFFFGSWFILYQFNWLTILKVEKVSQFTEEQLENVFWDHFRKSMEEIQDKNIILPVDSLLTKLCNSNGIDRGQIKLHILNEREVNAFALPNHHLVILSGMILACENETELAGVIAHELSHIENGHVSKKITKEVGLSMIISMVTGNIGNGVTEVIKLLTSTAYDRKLEKEADFGAVDYLKQSSMSPEPFANLLSRLSEDESKLISNFNWVASHPNLLERAEYIRGQSKEDEFESLVALNENTWRRLKMALENELLK